MNESHENLLESFRAYLHTIITGIQCGKSNRIQRLPGPDVVSFCSSLAELPENALASELVAPVNAVIRQIDEAATFFHQPLYKRIKDPAEKERYRAVLKQVDLAIALIFREITRLARRRTPDTQCSALLMEILVDQTNARDFLALIHRWQKEFAEDLREPDGSLSVESIPDCFAWDTAQRVATLDRLADEYPDHVGAAARSMNAWPMLVHPHGCDKKRLDKLVKRLRLTANDPLAAGSRERFRGDTPMACYLDPLVSKLADVRKVLRSPSRKNRLPENERADLKDRWWWIWPEKPAGDAEINLLRILRALPELTKATATEWAEKIVVPVIMLTDGSDWRNCQEPALKAITHQRGAKSQATFKARLLAAVSSTLRRLAHPSKK